MSHPTTFVAVKSLPAGLQTVLARVGFRRPDISIRAADTCNISCCGGDGYQGFAITMAGVQADSGSVIQRGSWGGPNPFGSAGPVDDIHAPPVEVPERGAIITGRTGGSRPVTAEITVRPLTYVAIVAPVGTAAHDIASVASDMATEGRTDVIGTLVTEALAACQQGSDLTDLERKALGVFSTYKSSYRLQALAEINASTELVDSLVERGYLKRSSNGATALTLTGKNAKGRAW